MPLMNDNDAISILEEWLAPKKMTLDDTAFVFSKVDAELGLPDGTSARLLETAAKKFDYILERRGEATLKLKKGSSWYPSAPQMINIGSSRRRGY